MKAWVLGGPGELNLVEKPVPTPGVSEVLVRVDAAAICATDQEVISHGPPATVAGKPPFNRNHTPGHEYMGTIVALGPTVDEFTVGERVVVEIHAGCGRCERCRQGMYTSCWNYGRNYGAFNKGHRANGFTTDGGFAQYAVNHTNTLHRAPSSVGDELATMIVTAGTAMYGLDVLGGLLAGQSLIVTGAGPIGLMVVSVAKALGANPVILSDVVDERLHVGLRVGADVVVNATRESLADTVMQLTGGRGAHLAFECSGVGRVLDDVLHLVSRGGRVCLGAFSNDPALLDVGYIVTNNIYLYGIRGEGQSAVRKAASLLAQGKYDPSPIHTHTFPFEQLPEAMRYAREKVDGAIKVVVKM
jgi:L-iditol 2-dehydrogenase